MNQQKHVTPEGLQKIIDIKAGALARWLPKGRLNE
jgi:hypothetical protein